MEELEILVYRTRSGKEPYWQWFEKLDPKSKNRVDARLASVRDGNYGVHQWLGQGVFEFKLDFGPGYRIYFSKEDRLVVLLLCSGDKSTQRRDIERAKDYLVDYKAMETQGVSHEKGYKIQEPPAGKAPK